MAEVYKVTKADGSVVYRRTGGSATTYSSRSEAEAVPNTTKSSSGSSTSRYTAPSGETVVVGTETIGGKDYAVIVGSPSAIESATKRSSGGSSTQRYTTPSGRTVTVGTETIGGQQYQISVGSPEAIREAYPSRSGSSSQSFGVYDVRNQQTRIASVIEAAAVQQQINNSKVSSAVSSSGFTDARTLINGKNVDAVYFIPEERGSRPVAVLNKAPDPASSITGTLEAAPKRSVFSYKLGEFKDKFKQGFGLQPDPLGRDPRTYTGAETAGYVLGTNLAIVSSSSLAYEWIGAKLGSAAYNSPKVWNLVEKGGRALNSPVGQLGQRGLLVTYATFESANLADAYFKEGGTGLAREGLTGPVRDVAFFGGLGSGFKAGASEAASKTFYLVKGDVKVGTEVRGSEFRSSAVSRGEVYEFTGEGKLRREFYFEDVGGASGSQVSLKKPSFREVQTSFGPSNKVTTVNLIDANVANRVKLQSLQSGKISELRSFADVQVIQRADSVKLTSVNINGVPVDYGRGVSKFNFIEGKEVRFDSGFDVRTSFGQGKNIYSYTDYPSLKRTEFKGRVSSIDRRITSQFGFEETVIKRDVVEVYDLGGSSASRSKTVSEQTSKTVVSLLSPKVQSGGSPVLPIVKGSGSSSQKADVKTESQPVIRDFSSLSGLSSAAVVSDVDLVPVGPVSRSDFLLKQSDIFGQRSRVIGGQSSKRSQGFDPVFDIGVREEVISRPVSVQGSILFTKQNLRSDSKLRQESLLESRQVLERPAGLGSFGGFSSFVNPPTPPPVFNLPVLPQPKSSKGGKAKVRQADFSGDYVSSIEANVFNIEGVKPSDVEVESGLFLRPILKGGKRRKK